MNYFGIAVIMYKLRIVDFVGEGGGAHTHTHMMYFDGFRFVFRL